MSDQIRAVAEAESIPLAFPEDVERAAIALTPPERPEKGDQRRNLERLPFVTIDGEDARDFDDAIYVKRSGAGFNLLARLLMLRTTGRLVADWRAIERGTSVYFPEPYYPCCLSTFVISVSLRPDEALRLFVN